MKINLILKRVAIVTSIAVLALVTSSCQSKDPLSPEKPKASSPIVVGSQQYYSNEIVAEIYAQALEKGGFKVKRQFNIGQRESYMPALEKGEIDVFPEYTGNLLQYYDKTTTAKKSDDVYTELKTKISPKLQVLDQADATDQDSYVVTKSFSEKNQVTSLDDLQKLTIALTLGGNIELETRPYGPDGLKKLYGVSVGFTSIEDSGGPLTQKALNDDKVQLVNVYTADPSVLAQKFVTLKDPKGLFLASHLVPIVSKSLDPAAQKLLNKIQAKFGSTTLLELNTISVEQKSSPQKIAEKWLAENKISS